MKRIYNCLLIISYALLIKPTALKIPMYELDFYFINSFNQYSVSRPPNAIPAVGQGW